MTYPRHRATHRAVLAARAPTSAPGPCGRELRPPGRPAPRFRPGPHRLPRSCVPSAGQADSCHSPACERCGSGAAGSRESPGPPELRLSSPLRVRGSSLPFRANPVGPGPQVLLGRARPLAAVVGAPSPCSGLSAASVAQGPPEGKAPPQPGALGVPLAAVGMRR